MFMKLSVITFLLSSIAFSSAYAEKRTIGDWAVSPSGGIYEAFTANDSGSTFGVLCTADDCKFYLRLGTTCEKDASYKTLINSDAGANAFKLSCSPLTIDGRTEYVLLIDEQLNSLSDTFLNSSTIGFAMPMAGGQFKVSRFSLRGFSKAMELVGNLRKKNETENKSQGIRDTNL